MVKTHNRIIAGVMSTLIVGQVALFGDGTMQFADETKDYHVFIVNYSSIDIDMLMGKIKMLKKVL